MMEETENPTAAIEIRTSSATLLDFVPTSPVTSVPPSVPPSLSATPQPSRRQNAYPPTAQRSSLNRTNTLTSQYTINTLNTINALRGDAPAEAWMRIRDYNLRVDGLPTLNQVLEQKTQSPLSQYNLYTYLRVRHKAEDNLNFWLDVEEHGQLWLQYETAERRRQETNRRDQPQKESDRAQKKRERMSQLLGPEFEAIYGAGSTKQDGTALTSPPPVTITDPRSVMTEAEREEALEAEMRYFESQRPTTTYSGTSGHSDVDEQVLLERGDKRTTTTTHSALRIGTKDPGTLSHSDMLRNAERIYLKYCSPFENSRRIQLPEDYRLALHELIEVHKQPHPLVFQSAKDYAFELIDTHYYPKFLDSAVKTNLTRAHSNVALALGALAMTAGFSLELAFIFLGSGGPPQRVWGLMPMFFGRLLIITAVEKFLVVLTIFRYSETTFFRFHRIKEQVIQNHHNRKALQLTSIIAAAAIVTTLIFIFIPAHPMT